jgi:regulator of sigma E protease
MKNVPYTLKWLITGDIKLTQLMGPVGIVATIGNAASQSENNMELFINLLGSFALISVAIGATNLVPFPALDGNKLVLLFVEAIRRKPLPVEKEAAISIAGIGVLMIFAIFVTWADINRVISGFFNP